MVSMAQTLYVSNPRRGRARIRRNPTQQVLFSDATSPETKARLAVAKLSARTEAANERRSAKAQAALTAAARADAQARAHADSMARAVERVVPQLVQRETERAVNAEARRVAAEDRAAIKLLTGTAPSTGQSRKRRSGGHVAKRKISAAHLAKMQAGRKRWLAAGGMSKSTSKRVRSVKGRKISRKRWATARNATGIVRQASRSLSMSRKAPRGKRRARVAAAGRSIQRYSRKLIKNPLVVSNPMSGIPVLGTAISLVGPAFFGGVGIELSGQVYKYAGQYVPESIAPYMDKAKFTIGGLVIAGVVQMLPFLSPPLKHSLGLAFASAGGGVDWYRYRSSEQAYGDLALGDLAYSDGGNWSVEYGDADYADDEDAMGDLALADTAGDEEYSGLDFGNEEGEAMAEGFGVYHAKFPHKRGSWHWLAKEFGPEEARKLANMPPEQRVMVIAECKQVCRNAINRQRKQIGMSNLADDSSTSHSVPVAEFETYGI